MGRGDVPDEFPSTAVAVRGGRDMSVVALNKALDRHVIATSQFPESGSSTFCLSFGCVADLSPKWVACIARRDNTYFCWMRVQDILDAGFVIKATPGTWHDAAHCDVFLADGPTTRPSDEQLDRLSKKFSIPTENPVRPR